MIEISLGQRLHELRDRADLTLAGIARKVGISSPFLSDIELGRRFPSEEILAKLAGALNIPLEDLKQHDNREPIADLKRPRLLYSAPGLSLHLSAPSHPQAHQGRLIAVLLKGVFDHVSSALSERLTRTTRKIHDSSRTRAPTSRLCSQEAHPISGADRGSKNAIISFLSRC